MIERRELFREDIRVLLQNRTRESESEMLSRMGERGDCSFDHDAQAASMSPS